jgi:hypothetical protein
LNETNVDSNAKPNFSNIDFESLRELQHQNFPDGSRKPYPGMPYSSNQNSPVDRGMANAVKSIGTGLLLNALGPIGVGIRLYGVYQSFKKGDYYEGVKGYVGTVLPGAGVAFTGPDLVISYQEGGTDGLIEKGVECGFTLGLTALLAFAGAKNGGTTSRIRGNVGGPSGSPTTPNALAFPDYPGIEYSPAATPTRIYGPWTKQDLVQGSKGFAPKSLGPTDLHHAGQMPGSGVHEIPRSIHQQQTKSLHPNDIHQGVTKEIRDQDRSLHWWYRSREMGLDQIYPNSVYD